MCPQPRAKRAELLSFLRLLWHAVGLPRVGSSRAFVHDDAVAPTRESASGPFGRTRRRSRQLLGLAQLLLRLVHALLDLARHRLELPSCVLGLGQFNDATDEASDAQ